MVRMVAFWILTLVSSFGCTRFVEHPATRPPANATTEETVATVNGIPIAIGVAEDLWHRNPSWTRDRLVRELVDRELLAQDAELQGTLSPSRVVRARKRGLVRAFLKEKVELQKEPDPQSLGEVSEIVLRELTTPAGFRVSHLVVLVRGKPESKEDAENNEAAKKIAAEIAEQIGPDGQLEDLIRLRDETDLSATPGIRLMLDPHVQFARPGDRSKLPNEWSRPSPDFVAAVVDLADRGLQVSKPIESVYGWHVAIVEEILEPKVPSSEVLEKVVLARARTRDRETRVLEILKAEYERSSVALFPEVVLAQADPERAIR
jgi:hypothetical protein